MGRRRGLRLCLLLNFGNPRLETERIVFGLRSRLHLRGFPSIAKPMTGLGAGVMELAPRYRGDVFRVVYALQIGADLWVVHAVQKKSKSGIATPGQDIDLVQDRLKRLKEALG